MSTNIEFILLALGLLLVWGGWSLKSTNIKEWTSGRTGKGILSGIIIVTLVAGGLVLLSGCRGTYLNDASIYAGLDRTKKMSPSCENDGSDTNTTSNMGARVNMYQSKGKKFRTNMKYTHHSCVFSPDSRQYDALGVELEYKIWSK